MSRKGENIYLRKDKRWEARFIIGRKYDGRAIYKSVYAHSYRDVREKRNKEIQLLRESGTLKKMTDSVTAISEEWLADGVMTLKESSICRYREKLRLYVLPRFGDRSLSDITTEEVNDFIIQIQTTGFDGQKPVGSSSAALVLTVLKHLRSYAVKKGFTVQFSPEYISIKRTKKNISILTEKDVKTLVSETMDETDNVKAGILACMFTGMRIGELCALRFDDIDLDEGIIHVRNTMQRLPVSEGNRKTRVIIGTPKSECSIRDIPISTDIANVLKVFYRKGAFLLTGDTKKYMEPRTMENRFTAILKKCGIDRINFHTLRHTFATACVERGMDIKALSEVLGHSSVSITLDRYVHITMKYKASELKCLSDLFAVSKNGQGK